MREPSFACEMWRVPFPEPDPHRLECVIVLATICLGAVKAAACPPAWMPGRTPIIVNLLEIASDD